MSKSKLLTLSLIIVIGLPAAAMAESVRQHDAHEHGVSNLKIAIDNNEMQFILEAPGSDIVGFEHLPENSEQKAKVKHALELLDNPDRLFKLPLKAGCSTVSVETNFSLEEEPKSATDDEEGHAEFNATYLFSCSSPGNLKTIGIQFFDQFLNAEEIELQAVSGFGQLSAEITSDQRIIDLSSIAE